jgi:stearoyl-CoA desaturase (delta-9 desaturase)
MSESPYLTPTFPHVPIRDQFAAVSALFVVGVHVAALAAFWHTTWSAVLVCLAMHGIAGGLGICVGYHRLLTHRSFMCPKWLERTFATFGALSIEGGPIEWVAHHRQHHQYSDAEGDPHSAREGFWWSHMLWMFWLPRREGLEWMRRRYAPDLVHDRYYRFLSRTYPLPTLVLGTLLYFLGGWPWVVWGVFVRLVLTYHHTWLVNSASHKFGYRNFEIEDLSTNCWWVAAVSYGEGWHNNHHAFPTSARHGLNRWEFDPAYGFIKLLEKAGLARNVKTPSAQRIHAVRERTKSGLAA